jgi:signal transduction histidine kinase
MPAAHARGAPLVLVVEDNPEMNRFVCETLEPAVRTVSAFDGDDGLAKARELSPDLIVSDVMMPGMSGDELVRRVRAEPALARVPLLLLTARADDELRIQLLRLGAQDYVTKPFAVEELRARVDNLVTLKRAQDVLVDSRAAAEAARQELETFSYSVSHDLRTPLRGVDGFSQLLLDDYGDRLDAEGADYLRRIRAAARRMSDLIDGLLELARVTRLEIARETVDVSALATSIVEELRTADPAREVTVEIVPDLRARGDQRLVRLVLQNLVGNAWKFTRRTAAARIEVGAVARGDHVAYFVRDNGAGFEMEHAERLFAPFQRLHSESEFPGTGIGLATVQRIVTRHGGRIWAEAAPGAGATFWFTLAPEIDARALLAEGEALSTSAIHRQPAT